MSAWKTMETCPRDGTWVILECETGGHLWEPRVGRWNPTHVPGIGTYEWEVIERRADGFDTPIPPSDVFNHYASPDGWMPLPAPPLPGESNARFIAGPEKVE